MRYRFEGMEFDAVARTLHGPNGPIAVRAQSLAVLEHLLEQSPGVVSRDELLDAVWGHQSTSDSSVAQTIRELRAALDDSSTKPRFIATRRRIGYQFVAPIERINGDDDAEQPTTMDSLPVKAAGVRHWIAAALTLILAVAVWRWASAPDPSDAFRPAGSLALSEVAFDALDEPDSARSAALRSLLGQSLARADGLRVFYRTPDSDAVDYIVDARAREQSDGAVDLTIHLQAPNADNAAVLNLFSERADLAALGDSLARAILVQLGLDGEAQRLSSAPPIRLPSAPSSQKTFFRAVEAVENFDADGALTLLATLGKTDRGEVPVRLLESRALAMRGDILSARESTRQLLALTELWPRRERLSIEATAAMQANDFERAADRLQALNQFYPEPSSVRLMIEAQIGAGRLDAAGEAIEQLDRLVPGDPRTHLLRARLQDVNNDPMARLDSARSAQALAEAAGLPRIAEHATREVAGALTVTGELDEALRELETLADRPEWRLPAVRAPAHLLEARIRFQRGELDLAVELAELAESEFTEVPDTAGIADARIIQGSALEQAGRVDASVQRLEAALPLLEELGETASLARAHVNLGIAMTSLGDYESAQQHLGLAGAFYREAGDRRGEGAALLNQGSLLARSNRTGESESAYERAVEAFVDAGDQRGQAIALGNLASNASQRGETRRAVALNSQALELFREIGADIDAARTAFNLGLIHRRLGELDRAESMIRESAEFFLLRESVSAAARTLVTRGSILIDTGRLEEAVQVLGQIDDLDLDSPMRVAEVESLRGDLALATASTDSAREHFKTAHDLREGSPDWQLMSDLDLARVALADGELAIAEQEARRLIVSFREARDVYPQIDAMLIQADSLIRQSRFGEAEESLAGIEKLIDANRDALQNLQFALLRAQVLAPELAGPQLEWVRSTAAETGFEPLAGEAERLLSTLPRLPETN